VLLDWVAWKSQVRGLGKDHIIRWVTYLLAQAWWGDQLIAADVAGAMAIREALSEYASQLYMRRQRSATEQDIAQKTRMHDFFRSLGKIDFQEPPLTDIYNELPIARHKGAMILELIADQIGQETLLNGIRAFLRNYRYQPAPYATVLDLQDAVLSQTDNPRDQDVIRELFSEVVSFQVGIADATYMPRSDGEFLVHLTLEAEKRTSSELGKQQPEPLDLPVTLRLYDAEQIPIFTARPVLSKERSVLTVITDKRPAIAAIDPDYVLPSSYLQDNVKRIRPAGH
jgi:aminopeptidase N